MKKIFILVFLFSFITILSGCTNAETSQNLMDTIRTKDKITVGVKFDSKPFGYIKNSKLEGYDIELAKKIAKLMLGDENKVEFKEVTPENRISSLATGKVDMVIATMSVTPQRELVVDFSTPYFVAGQAILVHKNSKIKNVYDLNDKKVTVVLGTTGETTLRKFAPNAIVKGYISYKDAFEALKNGSVEAMSADDSLLLGFIADNKDYKILPRRLTQEYYAIALKKDSSSLALKRNINLILKRLYSKGELNKLRKKWILE